MWPVLLRSKGVQVGDRVGLMVPNVPHFAVLFHGAQRAGAVVVPMNVLLKAREVAFYLEDSGAKLLFAWSAFAEDAEAGAAAAGAECVLVDPEALRRARRRGRAEHGGRRARGRRHRGDPLHLGHDGHAEGRRAHARQPHAATSRSRASCSRSPPTTSCFGGLPLFHVFGLTCGLNTAIAAGGDADAAAAVRSDEGAARSSSATGSRSSRAFRRCTARCSTTRTAPTTTSARCVSASRAARRCRSRCCAGSTPPSTARSSRATGCRRPRRSRRSTTPTASASRARSARRSEGSR